MPAWSDWLPETIFVRWGRGMSIFVTDVLPRVALYTNHVLSNGRCENHCWWFDDRKDEGGGRVETCHKGISVRAEVYHLIQQCNGYVSPRLWTRDGRVVVVVSAHARQVYHFAFGLHARALYVVCIVGSASRSGSCCRVPCHQPVPGSGLGNASRSVGCFMGDIANEFYLKLFQREWLRHWKKKKTCEETGAKKI